MPGAAADPGSGALYPRLLGAGWATVHPQVRGMHLMGERLEACGRFCVEHGPGRLGRLLARLSRAPSPRGEVQVLLVVERDGHRENGEIGERWVRTFGGETMITTQGLAPGGLLAERFGALKVRFRVTVEEGGLAYRQAAAALRLGRLRLPLPAWAAPRIAATELPAADGPGTHVEVTVSSALAGRVLRYHGRLTARVEEVDG